MRDRDLIVDRWIKRTHKAPSKDRHVNLTGKSKEQRDARSRFNRGPLDQEDAWRKIRAP
jgi:hypothetical protein